MFSGDKSNNVYMTFNAVGVATAYIMMGASIWLAPVNLSTKGYWAMGIFMLTLSLVNLVKYKLDDRASDDRINKLEAAKNEKILEDYVVEKTDK